MRGAVLYRPGDVRFEERAAPAIIKPTDAIIRIIGDLRLRVGPVALPRPPGDDRADADGTRILRDRRRSRQRGHNSQTRPIRHRLVLRLR